MKKLIKMVAIEEKTREIEALSMGIKALKEAIEEETGKIEALSIELKRLKK